MKEETAEDQLQKEPLEKSTVDLPKDELKEDPPEKGAVDLSSAKAPVRRESWADISEK